MARTIFSTMMFCTLTWFSTAQPAGQESQTMTVKETAQQNGQVPPGRHQILEGR